MTAASRRGIAGDWSGIKGTEYHILYAIWLLVREHVPQVAFYQGNDLVARTLVPPPLGDTEEDSAPAVPVHVEQTNADLWIQLKSGPTSWSLTRILDDLLGSFVLNALHSELQGRNWHVRLATEGSVERADVLQFAERPSSRRNLNQHLQRMLHDLEQRWQAAGQAVTPATSSRMREIALRALKELAETVTAQRDALVAEIELELAYACPDREAVLQIANALRGALLSDASGGPNSARTYDARWLEQTAGYPLAMLGQFEGDPVGACTEQVRSALPPTWRQERFACRRQLAAALEQFLRAPETAFVLVGSGGTGKSWATADWASNALSDRVRVLISGPDLDHRRDLPALVDCSMQRLLLGQWASAQRPGALLERLRAASCVAGRGSLVVIVDGVRVPDESREVFREALGRLVRDCRVIGAKVVLTCERQVWEFFSLAAAISPQDIFLSQKQQTPAQTQQVGATRDPGNPEVYSVVAAMGRQSYVPDSLTYHSLVLGDLTLDELMDALNLRLPAASAQRAASHLQRPEFMPLRNPFLFGLYMDEHAPDFKRDDYVPDVAYADRLLDTAIARSLEEVRIALCCSYDDVTIALNALLDQLWGQRPSGLLRAQAVDVLRRHLGDMGNQALQAMQRAGILTLDGRIRLAQPLVAERLYARLLGARLSGGADVAAELRPEVDAGVVTALIRGVADDPVPFAASLLQTRDGGTWTQAVSDGVAQSQGDEYARLAMLSVLARSHPKYLVGMDGANALGQLAARSDCAWRWVAGMYLGNRLSERYRGGQALATAMEFVPRRVEAAIRLRVRRAQEMEDGDTQTQRRHVSYLGGAFRPLAGARNALAAKSADRVIRCYGHIAGLGNERVYTRLQDDLDEARGTVALFSPDQAALGALLQDLRSPDAPIRLRAGRALRSVVFEQPGLVQDALCAAIRQETDDGVMNRLLWSSYRLTETAPELLSDSLAASFAVQWQEPVAHATAGMALALLAGLARCNANRVLDILPRHLDGHDPESVALLSEILAYAWWCCAETMEDARACLQDLCDPALDGVGGSLRTFAWRGAAIAQLGIMSLDISSAAELAGAIPYPFGDARFLFLDTDDYVRRHAQRLLGHPLFEKLRERLLQSLREEDQHQVHPTSNALRTSQYWCAQRCLEALIQIAAHLPDPLVILNALPRDWQALHAAWRLLDLGRREPPVREFAQLALDEHVPQWSSQALDERERCRAALAVVSMDEGVAGNVAPPSMDDALFETQDRARTWAQVVDADPSRVLSRLQSGIRGGDDMPALYYWEEETRRWQSLLIARVYARMFAMDTISVREARELCQQMLVGVHSLPDSREREEYLLVYGAISSRLNGAPMLVDCLSPAQGVVDRSHELAALILNHPDVDETAGCEAPWIDGVLYDQRGRCDTDRCKLDGGSFSTGLGPYTAYVFPAVRLALIAVARGTQLGDPAAQVMQERTEATDVLRDYGVYAYSGVDDPAQVLKEASAIQKQIGRTPMDERLYLPLSTLLLKMGDLQGAEEAVERCLGLAACQQRTRAAALYNLACARCRKGMVDECRRCLEESIAIHRPDLGWMAQDPDLAGVRNEPWFVALLEV